MKPLIIELVLKDTEKVDWKKGLSSYLKKIYGPQQWSHFYDEKLTRELDGLRNNANGELAPESLLDQNLRYYAFLEQLSLRLGNNSSQLRLNFTWYDAEYSTNTTGQKYTQHTLTFEKSSIIYNIGSTFNQLAREKINDDYKKSIGYLTKAMSCFNYLSENFLNSPSIDLHAENTHFLAILCQVEAQEIFLLNLLNGPDPETKASLVSKLATATFHLYEQCNDFLKTPEGGLVPYGEPRWSTIVTCKSNLYRSVAAHYQALYLEQQNKIGEAIAFSKVAHLSLVNSLPFKAWLKDYVDFDGFKEQINQKSQQLAKDNDYIYHDQIPSSVSLDTIKVMNAIKNLDWSVITEPYMKSTAEKSNSLYKGIVQMEVYEKESIYSEQKAKVLRREVEATETANLEYTSFVEFTHLPSLLSDLEKRYKNGEQQTTSNPEAQFMREQIASWITTVRSNPYSDIQTQVTHISDKRREISDILKELPAEEKENAVKLKSSLVDASRSDDKLLSLLKPYNNELNLLKNESLLWKEYNQFESADANQPSLLDIDDTKTEKILTKINEVKQVAEELKVLRDERNDILEELKTKINEDDITSLLIEQKGLQDNVLHDLFETELEKFSPLSTRLEATIFKQTSLINEVKITLDSIFALSGFREKNTEEMTNEIKRKQFFKKLEEAMTNFAIFVSDIQKGLQFYDSLISMSKNLLTSSKNRYTLPSTQNTSIAPPLPDQPTKNNIYANSAPNMSGMMSIDRQMNDLNLSSQQSTHPPVPPRTYGNNDIPSDPTITQNIMNMRDPGIPQLPPKQATNIQNQNENDEQELRRNPTAFYDQSPVFDENLYFRYGK